MWAVAALAALIYFVVQIGCFKETASAEVLPPQPPLHILASANEKAEARHMLLLEHINVFDFPEYVDESRSSENGFSLFLADRALKLVMMALARKYDPPTRSTGAIRECMIIRERVRANIYVPPGNHILSWRQAMIEYLTLNGNNAVPVVEWGRFFITVRPPRKVSALFALSSSAGEDQSTPGQQQGVDKSYSSDQRKNNLRPCGYYLPLSGVSPSLRAIGGVTLGLQIIGIMLVGFLIAIPGTLGLYWVFDDPNRNRKLLGAGLASVCLPITGFLYGWGLTGHPLGLFGLC